MSKVITFSRTFPSYHPRAGEPTFFVEKIWACLADMQICFKIPPYFIDYDFHQYYNATPKVHTIRSGNRWKIGDKFSPRVWSGKPYKSKQVAIAPDIEIKKIYHIDISPTFDVRLDSLEFPFENGYGDTMAKNDGLALKDFQNWFSTLPFSGQIICWDEPRNYKYYES